LRGGRNVTDAEEDFLDGTCARSKLSLDEYCELPTWPSSDIEASVVVLASVDAVADGGDRPFDRW
jgi:hypothetical protein